MHFTINLKRLGKKKIKTIAFELGKRPETLRELIVLCVNAEVGKFNHDRLNNQLLPFLTRDQIAEQASNGKVGFGEIENTTLADASVAVANAIQCFEDGVFVVFIDEVEIISLDQNINLNDYSSLAFLRMTFLTGTYF